MNNHNYAIPLSMKRALSLAILLTVAVSTNANAFFFFFLPGSVTSKIGDALTGSEGENCVSATAKVGDTLTSNSSNTAIIKSLSGTSSRCPDSIHPIRALLQFNYSFSSKAGIDLPEGFKPKELTPTEMFNGVLLNAQENSKRVGVFVSAQPRKQDGDGGVLAKNLATQLLTLVEDGKTSNEEELTINGLQAYRFRMVGKSKGMFGRSFTYVVTVLVGNDEFVQVNATCLTGDFEKYKGMLDHFAYDIKGLNVVQPLSTISMPVNQPTPALPTALPVPVRVAQPAPAVASPTPAPVTTPPLNVLPTQSEVATSKLRALNALYKDGVINEKDFETKKQEILESM